LHEWAFAVGRVTTTIADGQQDSERVDWSTYIDEDSGVIESMTGELTWNTAERFIVVDTPQTQAVVGFAQGQTFELGDVNLTIDSEFASVLVTALDGQTLGAGGRVLLTAVARDQQLGAEYNEDGTQLLAMGGPPLLLEPVQVTLTYTTSAQTGWGVRRLLGVHVLDAYGVPTGEQVPLNDSFSVTIDGRYGAFTYLLQVDQDTEGWGSDTDTGWPDGDGCGCQSAPSRGVLLTFLPLLTLLILRRRGADSCFLG